MFKKPFKVKSNTQIKSSEKKSLKELIIKKFPTMSDADVEDILPKKETAFCSKILTANNKHVMVYSVQKRPILFSLDDLYYPTVYLLWRYPILGITFTTNDFVLTKVAHGADLMIPGIYANPAVVETFLAKQVGIINNVTNRAAVAVGAIAMSSKEMKDAVVGKCVLVYHVHGDKLCSMEDMSILSLPQLGNVEFVQEIDEERRRIIDQKSLMNIKVKTLNDDEFPPLGGSAQEKDLECNDNAEQPETLTPENEATAVDAAAEDETVDIDENDNDSEGLSEVEQMDILLNQCFLTALKYSKTLEIPLLTSSFYKLQMIPVCPEGRVLDVKKSSYKKVGQFLRSMEKEGLIEIKEKKKGVETIDGINKEHEKFVSFNVDLENRPRKPVSEEDTSQKRNIVESFSVTPAVLPLFKEFGLHKSDTMTTTEIKKYVTTYVKDHQLQDDSNKRFVHVENDRILSQICKNEKAVTWEDLLDKVTSSMKSCFKISTAEEQTLNKGKIQPIIMSTQTRSGNKKVTIVDNLDLYHIKLSEFAKECQRGVAASTSISRPPSKKSDQILIQGNQVLFVYNLLIDKYKIPKKYIRGLEHAPKNKK